MIHLNTLHFAIRISAIIACIAATLVSKAQDKRAQYPWFLKDLSTGVNVGYIDYAFGASQLNRGFNAAAIQVPHTAVRITLLDRPIARNLAVKVTYMRPVDWPYYYNVNGDGHKHGVFMNFGGITLRGGIPVSKKFALQAESGLGVVTRKGFQVYGEDAMDNAVYAAVLSGMSMNYHPNNKWTFNAGVTYAPGKSRVNQPGTSFYSAGFLYTMNALPQSTVDATIAAGYYFPKQLLQIGYASNGIGHGVNHFFANGAIPVFWGGTKWLEGLMLQYQRNIFHTRKVFSMDVGVSAGFWRSSELKQHVFTLAVFPAFRFTPLRTRSADFYFYYGVPGPCLISRTTIDGIKTGSNFTFQDLMGIGSFFGEKKRLNLETRIGHYSNGNIFPDNPGLGVPVTFCAGLTF